MREIYANAVRPFVYRRYLDYGVFESLREMKALIEREVERRELADNVKLGPGGIREIEFIVQAFQLIRGGRFKRLQTASLLRSAAAARRQQAAAAASGAGAARCLRVPAAPRESPADARGRAGASACRRMRWRRERIALAMDARGLARAAGRARRASRERVIRHFKLVVFSRGARRRSRGREARLRPLLGHARPSRRRSRNRSRSAGMPEPHDSARDCCSSCARSGARAQAGRTGPQAPAGAAAAC